MRRLLFTLLIFLFLSKANGQDDSLAPDQEQKQLEWCFVYSNLLGINIDYINNPNLYKVVGDWLGTPYKYSGESKNGIDCSGFVCKLYQSVYDRVLAGSAKDIYKEVAPIKKQELREGDLVFFKIKRGRISHVGIYLADNKFAHASTQRGVIISDLDEPYYLKYFFKGGRIKN
ncbi:MAG: C40 family peptidase [Bacteroidetes bacterium]|nr:C40 family peptidase [Bacteroidota bacterium]